MVIRTLAYHYADASAATRKAGARWYREALGHAKRLAKRHNVTVTQAAGVIAVLSQRQRWQRNLELADLALAGEQLSGIFDHQRIKLKLMLEGMAPVEVLRGPKITAFYHAILGDTDAVVLDTWMLETMNRPQGVTPKQYNILADRLRASAAAVGMTPASYQAVVWVQVRGSES